MARAPAVQEIEALPEADRLEEVPHPRATPRLFGHEAAERHLAEAVAAGTLHHGLLLAGPEGIGKATLAWRLARHILAEPAEREAPGERLDVAPGTIAARQVLALSHPGLLLIRRVWDTKAKRFTASIPIEEVRRIKSFLAHTAAGSGARVVIVDRADELNLNAANALLKSLEEPPPRTHVLLVAGHPGRLLATIRSRCRQVPLSPLGPADLRRAAEAALMATDRDPPGASEWQRLAALADGSVRRLIVLWLRDGLKLQERIETLFATLPRVDWGLVHGLGDELGSVASADRFETFHDLLMAQIARLAHAGAVGGGGDVSAADLARLGVVPRLATWAEVWETLGREKAEAMALNLDRKSLILEAFSRIASAARG